jgi:hypothetical protein
MKTITFLLISEIYCRYIEFNYAKYDCSGAPLSVGVYPNKSSSALGRQYMTTDEYEICGEKSVEDDECCRSSLDLGQTFGIASFVVDFEHEQTEIPGSDYCKITSLLNSKFVDLYIGKESCVNDFFKCINKEVIIYPKTGCQGLPETFAVTSNKKSLQSTLVGNFESYLISLEYPEKFHWTTFYPPNMIHSAHKYPIEYIGIFLFVISMCLNFSYTAFFFFR